MALELELEVLAEKHLADAASDADVLEQLTALLPPQALAGGDLLARWGFYCEALAEWHAVEASLSVVEAALADLTSGGAA